MFVWLASVLVTLWGAIAVWRFGWRHLYADQWRLYEQFVRLPFPESVLFLENGHRPVVPNLLRVAELHFAGGNQEWQLWSGLLLALGAVVLAWRLLHRDDSLTPVRRALAALVVAVGVFWLGNARMLMHPNESVHTYLIVFSLVGVAALAAALDDSARRSVRRFALGLSAAGLMATFSFGPGIALFPAASLMLFAARARPQVVALPIVAMVVVLGFYFVLPGGDGVRNVIAIRPVDNAFTALRWLGSLFVHLLQPLLDPNTSHWYAGRSLDPVAASIAGAIAPRHGPLEQARWPAVISALAVAGLVWRTLQLRMRGGVASNAVLLGLLFAWFGLGVAGIVSLSRLDYFVSHPGQVFANRYLPWVCLFWAGIALIAIGTARRPAFASAPIVAMVALALMLNPVNGRWSRHVQALVLDMNMALAADVFPSTSIGESVEHEVVTALRTIRQARIGVFAHPVSLMQGTTLDAVPEAVAEAVDVRRETIRDRRGSAAERIQFAVPPDHPGTLSQWMLIETDGTVVGVAYPRDGRSRLRVVGYVASAAGDELLAVPWIDGSGDPERVLRVPATASAGETVTTQAGS